MLDPLSRSVQQWLFLPAHLLSTPSARDRIPPPKELDARRRGVNLITSLLARLGPMNPARRVPERERRTEWRAVERSFAGLNSAKDVATTAAVFLHRFYMRHSLKAYPVETIAPACLYLALKIEERPSVKLHYVARATRHKLDERNDHDEQYYVEEIAHAEEIILVALCYDLVLDQPLASLLRGAGALSARGALGRYAGGGASGAENGGASASASGAGSGAATPAAGPPARAPPFPLAGARTPSASSSVGTPNPYLGARTPVGAAAQGQRYAGKQAGQGPDEPSERADRVVLELAYLICYETITTPLCLLALPQYIAAAALVLALSLGAGVHRQDVLSRVDASWVEAFGGGLGLEARGEKGVSMFRETLAATVEAIVRYAEEDRLVTDGFGAKIMVDAQPTVVPEAERHTSPTRGKPPDANGEQQAEINGSGKTPSVTTPNGFAPGEDRKEAVAPEVPQQEDIVMEGSAPVSTEPAAQPADEPNKTALKAVPPPGDVDMNDVADANTNSADEAGLAIPPPSDSAHPKTANILRAEIFEGSGLSEVPITKQVGRDVADITSQLLNKGNEGLAVDELGMSTELSADEAVLDDAPVEVEKQQM